MLGFLHNKLRLNWIRFLGIRVLMSLCFLVEQKFENPSLLNKGFLHKTQDSWMLNMNGTILVTLLLHRHNPIDGIHNHKCNFRLFFA